VNGTRNVRASPIASAETDRDVVGVITAHRRRRHLVSNRSLVVCASSLITVGSTRSNALDSAVAACDARLKRPSLDGSHCTVHHRSKKSAAAAVFDDELIGGAAATSKGSNDAGAVATR